MNDFDISITSHCNAGCPSCKRYSDYVEPDFNPNAPLHKNLNQIHMNFEIFKKVVENNYDNFFNKHVLYEGELGDPLVHPKIENFIEFGCKIFKTLNVVTNGGNRRPSFYERIANKNKKLMMTFSIDGLYDDTNQIYRRRVNTEKAINNMITFAKIKPKKTKWQFLVFEHNFFEIPEVLDLSKKYKIEVYIKINQRPKFILPIHKMNNVIKLYENNKHLYSTLQLAN